MAQAGSNRFQAGYCNFPNRLETGFGVFQTGLGQAGLKTDLANWPNSPNEKTEWNLFFFQEFKKSLIWIKNMIFWNLIDDGLKI